MPECERTLVIGEWIALVLVLVTSAALSRSRPDRRIKLAALTAASDEQGAREVERRLELLGRARLVGILAGILAPTLYSLISRSRLEFTANVLWALYGCAAATGGFILPGRKPIATDSAEIAMAPDRAERVGIATVRPWFLAGTAAAVGSLALYLAAFSSRGMALVPDRSGHFGGCFGISVGLDDVLWTVASASATVAAGVWIIRGVGSPAPALSPPSAAPDNYLLMLAGQLCLGSITAGLWLLSSFLLRGTKVVLLAGCSSSTQLVQQLVIGAEFSCLLVTLLVGWRYVVLWRHLAVRQAARRFRC